MSAAAEGGPASERDSQPRPQAPAKPGMAPPEVFLYYWDSRDGPGFEGWWCSTVSSEPCTLNELTKMPGM